MSDTESLDNISVSAPSMRGRQVESAEYPQQPQVDDQWMEAQSAIRFNELEGSENVLGRVQQSSYRAPTARMTQTPSSGIRYGEDHGGIQLPPSSSRPKRTKQKEYTDYDREIEAVDAARDRADPDYCDHKKTTSAPRNRKGTSSVSLEPGSSDKKTRYRHNPYAGSSKRRQAERDEYVGQMLDNWGADINAWLPAGSTPTVTRKATDRYAPPRLLEDPRDWKENLTRELARLSTLTRNRPHQARKLLTDVLAQKTKGWRSLELFPDDVRLAIQRLEGAGAGPPTVSPSSQASPEPEREDEDVTPEQTLNPFNDGIGDEDLTPEQTLDPVTDGLDEEDPTPEQTLDPVTDGMDEEYTAPLPRSPLSQPPGPEIAAKQQSRPAAPATPIVASNSSENGWDQEAEQERYEELELQFEEEKARLAMIQANRARFEQRRRMNEWARQHGNRRQRGDRRQEAIVISEY